MAIADKNAGGPVTGPSIILSPETLLLRRKR